MHQPEGSKDEDHPEEVWRLHKSLYRQRQSPKLWQDDVKAFLVGVVFMQCEIDHFTYIRSDQEENEFTAVYVHIDDLAITGNEIEEFKSQISSHWEMEDLGVAQVVVGIEISRLQNNHYSLSQSKFGRKILSQFNMSDCNPAATPLTPCVKLRRATDDDLEEVKEEHIPWCSAVGSLMYLSQCTRPDLAHDVGVLSQHLDRPGRKYWDAVLHVFRYLKGTIDLGIMYCGNKCEKM